MRFALVDQISDQIGASSKLMREALETWGRQVALTWMIPPPSVRISTGTDLDPANECPIYLQATLGDSAPGAAAYHDEDALGNQFIRCALDAVPSGNILRDPLNKGESLLGLAQHELGEAIVDPTADVWRQQPFRDRKTGRMYSLTCQEICDPVQEIADAMTLKDGTRADRIGWVYPAWFDGRRAQSRPVDSHGSLLEPLTLSPGGYQIVAGVSGEKNVFAAEIVEHHELGIANWRMKLKHRTSSRTMKRLAAFG